MNMAYQSTKKVKEVKKAADERIADFKNEYERWLSPLEDYHTNRFDRNWKKYTAYTETKKTDTKISDPVAPELIEKVVQKMFQRDPKFSALARGKMVPRPITVLMSNVLEYYWTCPERVQSTGTMRGKLKSIGREFCVTGNTGVETVYNQASDTPDLRQLPIEDVIFDPTKSLKTSDRYYIRQYVSIEYLEKLIAEKDEGGKITSGRFDKEVVEELKRKHKESPGLQDDPDRRVERTGGSSFQHPVEKILLVTIWEGKHCVRIADWDGILEEYDYDTLDEDPLDFAMDIEVPKVPYAFSFLDLIDGLTQAKDLLINQTVDYNTKLLNPPLFVDPNIGAVNKASLSNAYRAGGIVFATAQQAQHQPMPPFPPSGFQLLEYLQSRSESVSGIGAYLSGVPNQTNDKTQGTMGGTLALIEQASSPVQDRQLNIEESIIEPVVNKWLKLAGQLMSDSEEKYIYITGTEPKWIQVTKGLLTGKIKLIDLLTAELIDEEEFMFAAQSFLEEGKDPDKEIIFDVDWVIRVETGSMAEANSAEEVRKFRDWVTFAKELGLQFDLEKVSTEDAARANIKEPEQFYMQQSPMEGMTGAPMTAEGQPGANMPAPSNVPVVDQGAPPAPPLF